MKEALIVLKEIYRGQYSKTKSNLNERLPIASPLTYESEMEREGL